MLNKELLMVGEELWTLQMNITGDSFVDLILWDSIDKTHILWEGNPNTDIVTIRIPPKSTLLITHLGPHDVTIEDGCITKDCTLQEMTITVTQSEAYLEVSFGG